MLSIYKKDLQAYFRTPLGFVYCAVFFAVSGFLFGITTVYSSTTSVTGYFGIMIFGFIVLVPLLTMRSFSDERRLRTDQLLMTSPVSVTGIVMAKFLSAYTVFAATTLLTGLYLIPLSRYGSINMSVVFGCLIAMLLLGLAFVAIGIFVSSLTESIVTAAVGTMAVLIVSVSASLFNGLIDSEFIRSILSFVSLYSRYQNFTYGFFDVASAIYYLSIAAIFLFLSVRVQDSRRWS